MKRKGGKTPKGTKKIAVRVQNEWEKKVLATNLGLNMGRQIYHGRVEVQIKDKSSLCGHE